MKIGLLATATLVIASMGIGTVADAQEWGPPPPPPYGYAPPPPPPPPPGPPPYGYRYGYGYAPYRHYHRHCWTEWRHHGWERVRICE